MEDLVEAFKKARPEIWLFATKPVENIRAPSPLPKRSCDFEANTDESPRKLRRTRSSGRNKPQERTVVVDSAEDDDDYVPGKILPPGISHLTSRQKTGSCNVLCAKSL
jgi:E3 ubiquitin-protein ligase RAD18